MTITYAALSKLPFNQRERVLAELQAPAGALLSLEVARKMVPAEDCGGRPYTKDESEDIARFMVLGAEMQLYPESFTLTAAPAGGYLAVLCWKCNHIESDHDEFGDCKGCEAEGIEQGDWHRHLFEAAKPAPEPVCDLAYMKPELDCFDDLMGYKCHVHSNDERTGRFADEPAPEPVCKCGHKRAVHWAGTGSCCESTVPGKVVICPCETFQPAESESGGE